MARRHDRSSELLDQTSAAEVDVLSDVLRTVKLTGALFFPLHASSPWADEIPAAAVFAPAVLRGAQHVVSYHIVMRGACWATLRDRPPVSLAAGDIFVVPHGDPYVMSSAPGMRSEASADAVLSFFRDMAAGSAPSVLTEGGGGPERADLVCGFLACDIRPFNPVLETLPHLVHLPRIVAAHDHLSHLIEFALTESRQPRSGAQCVVLRLSEVLFVEVIRRYVDGLRPSQTGWLAGLRDPIVGRALALLHGGPAASWTLERLAREIGTSRSALADRFSELVGQPPMRYLAHWRMQLAARLLADGSAKVAAIARDVGYDSEEAFSRAFKKIVGVAPATWRRRSTVTLS
ncbi:MAG TPA: AraC family transcriptional regulator [Vicinamibacterales bacterium]|nr:AraC family transcriptional regulator [Vicinamibacterales bacterium]